MQENASAPDAASTDTTNTTPAENEEQTDKEQTENEEETLSFEEQAWKQRIDNALAETDCDAVSPRAFDDRPYTGPLIDTHWHIANIPDSTPREGMTEETQEYDEENPLLGVNTKITDMVCTLQEEGTQKVFAFFPVYEEIPTPMVELVRRTMESYPDTFVPFLMPPSHDDSPGGFPTVDAETLQNMLNIEPGLFKGYGEIGLYAREGGSRELPPDSKRLMDIYPIVREHGLIVYVHLGEGHKDNFERALEQNPDISFIWHGDQLIPYRSDGTQDLSEVEDILSNHPNAYYGVDELYGDEWMLRPEVSREEFLHHFDEYEELLKEDVATWKGFIERHPDQVLWGTDRGWSSNWSVDEDVGVTLSGYARAFIARLDPAVQEKFAYKNAERLITRNTSLQ